MASKTYRVLKNDLLGRYLVADRDLKQGQLILQEKPVFVGSQLNGPAKCFNCLKTINLLMCSFCNECNTALLCNNQCPGSFHSIEECQTLRSHKIKGQILAENPSVIFPLRCLLLRIYNPELFQRVLELEPHLDKRRDTAIWRRHRISVEDILNEMSFLSQEDLEEEIVQKVCGILDVNSFEVRPPSMQQLGISNPEMQCLRGLYPDAATMAHDCVANTHMSVDDSYLMSVYASVDIKKNEPILVNYTNVLQGTQDRLQHLQEGKYFKCLCKRCLDPSELGTELSSLVCHKCRRGLLRYVELENNFKIWQCNECKQFFKDFLISLAIEEARRRINEVDGSDVQNLEELYRKLLLTFHPNHYLMIELKQNMVALYAKSRPTKRNLNRKIDLCGRLMSVFSKLEPGISRLKALTMYELQSAIIDLSNKQYRDHELTDAELVSELETAEKILKDCVKYLLYEPAKSPEGRVAQVAMKELKTLRETIKNIKQDLLVKNDGKNDKKEEVDKRLKEKLMKSKEGEGKTVIENGVEGTNKKVIDNNDEKRGKKNKRKNKK